MIDRKRIAGSIRRSGPKALCEQQAMAAYRALISSNFESACSNLALKSHIASRISRKVADVLALSACPKAKMLLFRRYPMIVGSEILWLTRLLDLSADLVGEGIIWMSSKS